MFNFIKWLFFTVIISITPIGAKWMSLYTLGQEVTLVSLTGQGELLIIATAISSVSLGEMTSNRWRTMKMFATGLHIVLIMMSAIYFGMMTVNTTLLDPALFSLISLSFFSGATLLGSASTIAWSE